MWLKSSNTTTPNIHYSHFGLKYRTIDETVTDEVYASGRTFSGIATSFIQYPTTYIVFEFSDAANADVSELSCSCDIYSFRNWPLGPTMHKVFTLKCPSSQDLFRERISGSSISNSVVNTGRATSSAWLTPRSKRSRQISKNWISIKSVK